MLYNIIVRATPVIILMLITKVLFPCAKNGRDTS